MIIKTFLLLIFLSLFQPEQPPGTVKVRYEAKSTNWYAEIEYLDADGELQTDLVLGMPSGGWARTFYIEPGPWSFAAVGIKAHNRGVSCRVTIDGVLIQKDRDVGKNPMSNCSGQIKIAVPQESI